MICEICKKEYKNKQVLSVHIKSHNITYKEYYDRYLKSEHDGICPVCNKKTNWDGYHYYTHCSTKCSTLDLTVKNKLVNTNIKKYGVSHHFKSTIILKKQTNTNIKKYGVKYPLQNHTINKKQKNSMNKIYGVDNIFKTNDFITKNRKQTYIRTYELLKTKCQHTIPNFTIDNYVGSGTSKTYSWKCIHCNNDFERRYFEGKIPLCPSCFPSKRSNGQIELYNFLSKELKLSVVQNYKKLIFPQEIDFYIPSKNIAIEYNGNYWHSELNGKDKKYHIKKTKLCNQKGVKLIHIFEDEWIYKNAIVKSRLRNLFKLNKYKIYARKCEIREINSNIKNKFLNKYHIQGNDKSNIRLGAFYNNKMISVMTFCNLRPSLGNKPTAGEYELSRFCTIRNFTCIGIAGKLLEYFEKNYIPNKIITYADLKWSNNGSFYENIGFIKTHESPPSYYYIHKNDYLIRMHRYGFRKNILKDKLNIFDKSKTEWENMKLNGYDRIWDCGNLVFVKTKRA